MPWNEWRRFGMYSRCHFNSWEYKTMVWLNFCTFLETLQSWVRCYLKWTAAGLNCRRLRLRRLHWLLISSRGRLRSTDFKNSLGKHNTIPVWSHCYFEDKLFNSSLILLLCPRKSTEKPDRSICHPIISTSPKLASHQECFGITRKCTKRDDGVRQTLRHRKDIPPDSGADLSSPQSLWVWRRKHYTIR